jgi:D-alanyl-D-alanine carboxypeptidase (penicillin-binding protein 5/6)
MFCPMHSNSPLTWMFRFNSMSKRFSMALVLVLIALLIGPMPTRAATLEEGPDEPEIGAKAAIVVEYPSGRVLYSKSAHERRAPASTTKILTAILALEYGKLDDIVTVVPDDLVGESTMGLVNGEKQTMRELLYGMLLPSGNDAAMAIARTLGSRVVAGEIALQPPVARFAEMMNVRVSQLGLADSHFMNPSGLDADRHYSSAYDLASLTWYALHIPEFNEIVAQHAHDGPDHSFLNTNELLTRYEGADGVKTGLTDNAGLCLVGSATRDGHRLISVVLNAPRWYNDTAAILDYSYALLASDPVGAGAGQLSVSKRGAVSWLLGQAGDGAAPPMPLLSSGVQGGGPPVVSQAGVEVVGAPPSSLDASSSVTVATAGRSDGVFPWMLLLFATGGLFLLYKLSPRFRSAGARINVTRILPSRMQPATAGADAQGPVSRQPREASTLHSPRRREPNLLISSQEERLLHIDRAIGLALEQREGSSMAEFLMALRYGDLDVAELACEYRLSPSAFLALARAQAALSQHEAAHRTLLHGATVLPHHRPLRMALHQYMR